MLRHLLAAAVAVVSFAAPASAQLYFRDNFTTNGNLADRVPSSSIGGQWAATLQGSATAATSGGLLVLDNNTSNSSNAFGSATIGNSFASTTLTNLPRFTEWRFNMRMSVAPSGFGGSENGIAVVLAASATDLESANGYAVALGRSGNTIELVSFSGGLDATSNLTAVAASTVALANATNFASIRVTYNPSNDTWQLFVRDDGNSAVDPYTGTIAAASSLVTNTAFTSASGLNQVGVYQSYDTTDDRTATFDNFTIAAVPEPTTWALIGISAAGLVGGVYRYRRGAAKTLNTEVDVEANEVA